MKKEVQSSLAALGDLLQEQIGELDPERLFRGIRDALGALEGLDGFKVVCVAPDLGATVEELSQSPRDRVVMVRVDDETSCALDEWVATGAVKSRSEAAAVFIREGLKVRASELEELREAVQEVEAAKKRLRRQVEQVFKGGEA